MIIKQLTLATLDTGTLDFGFVGENEHIKFVIKCDSVFDGYPTATASLLIKAPDNTIYPKTVEVEGYNVGWVITASDTAYPGSGQIQLTFTEDGAVVKTVIANTNVKDSLVGDDPPPDPIADWISTANQILDKVDGMTATAESLPSGDDPSVTVETVDGHYNLEFGIPAGDPGDPTEIIDDNAGVGDVTKVWSANKSATELSELKSAIDGKAPAIYQTASGDIVTITDGADGMPLKECVVQINPVQSGTGDPSPENIRPLFGSTGCTVVRTSRNLLAKSFEYAGSVENTLANCFPIKAGTYRFTADSVTGAETWRFYIRLKDKYGNNLSSSDYNPTSGTYWYPNSSAWRSNSNISSLTFILNIVVDCYIRICFASGDSSSTTVFKNARLDIGTTATEYQIPNAQFYQISWQTAAGTVYGGNVNPLTGVLTVDMAQVDMGTLSWASDGNRPGVCYTFSLSNLIYKKSPWADAICSEYKLVKNGPSELASGQFSTNNSYGAGAVFFKDDAVVGKTPAEISEYLSGVQLVYELTTPQTYQLDPVQIKTLLGYNAIWADTGAVALTYPADTKAYIAEITDPDGNVIQVTGSTPSITGESGKRYVCGTVDSISITPPQTGIIDVVFSSGTTPTVLTVPNTVRFPAWFDATSLDASTTYEINIADGVYGAVMAWQT